MQKNFVPIAEVNISRFSININSILKQKRTKFTCFWGKNFRAAPQQNRRFDRNRGWKLIVLLVRKIDESSESSLVTLVGYDIMFWFHCPASYTMMWCYKRIFISSKRYPRGPSILIKATGIQKIKLEWLIRSKLWVFYSCVGISY